MGVSGIPWQAQPNHQYLISPTKDLIRARSLSDSTMKFLLCFLCLLLPFLSDGATHLVRREALPSPQRGGRRSISGRPQNRFIFGQAGNAGLAGAALGAATQYFANQIFNPCRRSGNRRVRGSRSRYNIVLFTLLF